MKIKFEWERIKEFNSYRAKVIGGWMVIHTPKFSEDPFLEDPKPFATTSCFIPDVDHKWEIE
jgi:hypothetical protein